MEQLKKFRLPDISSAGLHIIAMFFMLLDHMWATVTPGNDWMTCLGRIAFPIFAFMIVEGYFHTHDFRAYMKRILIFALISEIPFDFMYGASAFYPVHQNVLWNFLIALSGIHLIEKAKMSGKRWLHILTAVLVTVLCAVIAQLTMVDFYGHGTLIVFTFYFLRGRKWWNYLGQFLVMYYLNVEIGGLCYIIEIFGREFEVVRQSFAMLSLIPIWLYRGRRGLKSKPFQYFCYAFYPLHIAVLSFLMLAF